VIARALGERKRTTRVAKRGVGGLKVERLGIVNRCLNLSIGELGDD
jgi:hypothetical protein